MVSVEYGLALSIKCMCALMNNLEESHSTLMSAHAMLFTFMLGLTSRIQSFIANSH